MDKIVSNFILYHVCRANFVILETRPGVNAWPNIHTLTFVFAWGRVPRPV